MSELFDKRMKQLHSDILNSYSSLNVSLFAFDCIGEPQSEDGKATVDMLRKIKAEQLQTMQFLCDIMNPLDRLLDSLDEPIPCPACGTKGVIICEDGAWNCSDCNGGGAVGITPEAEADLGEIEHNGEKVMVKIKVVRGE